MRISAHRLPRHPRWAGMPESQEMVMRLQCPKCGTELLVEDDDIGLVVICTGCSSKLRAPVSHSLEDSDEEDSSDDGPLNLGAGDDGKYEDLVDMTAMVDIVFFLLIFFMITTASGFLSCIAMPPPKQDGSATPRAARPPISIKTANASRFASTAKIGFSSTMSSSRPKRTP